MMFYNILKGSFIIYHLIVLLLNIVLSSYIVFTLIRNENEILDLSKRNTYLLLVGLLLYNYINFSMLKRFIRDDNVTNIYMNFMYILYIFTIGFYIYNHSLFHPYGFYTSCVLVGLISLFKKKKYYERRRLRNNLRDLQRNEPREGEIYQV